MYFTGTIQMDPQTPVVKSPTTQTLWNKFFRVLTGQKALSRETESFTALEILRQLHGLLRSLNISDVLRLTVDTEVLYEDLQAKSGDRDQAFMEALQKLDPLTAEVFGIMKLTLLHPQKGMEFLLEVIVRREHPAGEYPLEIQVRGKADEGTAELAKNFRNFLTHLDFYLRQFFQVAHSRISDDVDKVLGEVVEPLVVEVMDDTPEEDFFNLARTLVKEFNLPSSSSEVIRESRFGSTTTYRTTRTTIIRK